MVGPKGGHRTVALPLNTPLDVTIVRIKVCSHRRRHCHHIHTCSVPWLLDTDTTAGTESCVLLTQEYIPTCRRAAVE